MPDHESWIMLPFLLFALFSPAHAQISLCGDGTIPQLVFTPTKIILNRDNINRRVDISCRYPPVLGMSRRSLALNRTLETSASSTGLVMANEDSVKDLGVVSGSTVTGTYNSTVNFTMPSTSCTDADHIYSCEAISVPKGATNPVSCLQTGRLSAVSEPTDVKLVVHPDESSYSVGDILSLTCSATAGLKKDYVRAEWVWEEKKGNDWTPLKTDIHLGRLMTVDGCLKVRFSVFRVTVHGAHNDKTYRCYMVKGGQSFKKAAASYVIKIDSFIFGLKTSHGAVVLAGIVISVLAFIGIVWVGVRHCMCFHVNKERAMYRERVMNRLDKLFRFEAELIGGVMKKRKIEAPEPEPLLLPTPKKRLEEEEEEELDPTEITIELQMPYKLEKETPSPSEDSDVESEVESDIYDPIGPMEKV